MPVFKEKTNQDSEKDVPTFGQKKSENMSAIEKYEKAYEQELKAALEDITGVKDVSIEVNLDSSEEKILEKIL
ncbi:Sporulation stage III protein AG [Bacillus pseudomycoides]|nr:Sporulation stage III protein AG [Bacillus pseudomycoides]